MGVKEMGELFGVGQAESLLAPRDAGEKGGSEKTLEVEYGVESATTDSPEEREHLGKGAWMEPCLAEEFSVEVDYSCQMGVIFEQRREFGTNEPANLSIREALSQGTKCRQCLDYVT